MGMVVVVLMVVVVMGLMIGGDDGSGGSGSDGNSGGGGGRNNEFASSLWHLYVAMLPWKCHIHLHPGTIQLTDLRPTEEPTTS